VSYERQPPGLTLLALLSVPASGGDTAWVSQVAAYERLSDPIKRLLEGLEAEHDGFRQAENARRDGKFVRREPVKNNHPIVRVHPVSVFYPTYRSRPDGCVFRHLTDHSQATGEKALYTNPGFTRRIIGLKDEESDALLQLLFKVRSRIRTKIS
jgi:sulfonate dioxygenase